MRKLLLCVTMIFAILMTGCNNEAITIQDTQDSKKSLEFIILEDEAVSAATKFLNKGENLESRSTANAKVETIWRNIKLDSKQSRNVSEVEIVEVPVYVVSYIDENNTPNGFVVTVGDKRVIDRVLVFSDEGNWDLSGIPEFEELFWDNVDKSLTQTLSESDIDMCDTYEYEEQDSIEKFAVNTFLTWGQSPSPYNDSVPLCTSTNANMPAGCVAVAMGQIMAHHKRPLTGTYIHPRYNRMVNTSYNWTKMKASTDARILPLTEGRSGVANLLAEIGYKVDMDYGCNGSGAYTWDVPNAFSSMGYNTSSAINFNRDSILNNINDNLPVYISGDNGTVGHAWVIEGYKLLVNNLIYGRDCPDGSGESIPPTIIDYNVNKYYLYFNLGWHNNKNNFYLADTFTTWMYPSNIKIVCNIQPK